MTQTVGVLALQGGVVEHLRMVEKLGGHAVPIRAERDFTGSDGVRVDALILPGGESSTIDRLLRRLELYAPLRRSILSGLPTLGTCAGLILLANEIEDPAPGQESLRILDITVTRNAFGPQVASTETEISINAVGVKGLGLGAAGAVRGALIRAPDVCRVGPGARSIAELNGRVVGVTSRDSERSGMCSPLGRVTGIAFHPELSGDPAIHRALMNVAGA